MDKEHILDYQDCKYLKKNIFISPVETVYRPIAHSPAWTVRVLEDENYEP